MHDEETELEPLDVERKNFLTNITILNAYYISPQNRTSFVIEFVDPTSDDNRLTKEIVRSDLESDMLARVLETFSYDDILENTHKRLEVAATFAKDLDEFIKSKENQHVEDVQEKSATINLEYLMNIPTEDLFKLKLEIFEDEKVQNSENRELRSLIRKSKTAIELMYHYYLITNDDD